MSSPDSDGATDEAELAIDEPRERRLKARLRTVASQSVRSSAWSLAGY